ncbi:hypothetical protein SAMN04488136_11647 [Vibrio xiamenensis]|uniref:Uncharacterized protein n=1 Tax=Vibrio xiamenensis TaxID=861298 RepID=A0A1G8CFY2_9VIBR|nr:hypothetical protein SAMN04488136_11647 [Vibrio xiamenensis]
MNEVLFIYSIHARQKLIVTYFPNNEPKSVTCKCAPLDFGPKWGDHFVTENVFYLWNYDSLDDAHQLYLYPKQVMYIDACYEVFCLRELVTWKPNWILPRDWGIYS